MAEQEAPGDDTVVPRSKLSRLSKLIPSRCLHQIAADGYRLGPIALLRRHMSMFGGIFSRFFDQSTAGYSLSFNGNISIQRIKDKADDENQNASGHSPPPSSSRMDNILRLEAEIRDLEQLYRRKVDELSQLFDE